MEMPSEEEESLVREYVLHHILSRPDTTYKKAIVCVIIFITATFAVASVTYWPLSLLGVFSRLPWSLGRFSENHPVLFAFLYYLIIYIICTGLNLKRAAIGCVKLYQHYAPERVRRKCLLKPTCSEYALIVIKKYGAIIGSIKTLHRLFYKCKGTRFYIDEP